MQVAILDMSDEKQREAAYQLFTAMQVGSRCFFCGKPLATEEVADEP